MPHALITLSYESKRDLASVHASTQACHAQHWPAPSLNFKDCHTLPPRDAVAAACAGVGGVMYHTKFFHPLVFDEAYRKVRHSPCLYQDYHMLPCSSCDGPSFRTRITTYIYVVAHGSFTAEGTFAAAAAKLPYLAELGVNTLELMPVMHFCGAADSWGYCPSEYP